METLEAIRTRRTIRKYSEQPVEFEKLMAVCEAGGYAPSSGNIQNWKFIVITNKETIREGLCQACLDQDPVQNAQAAIVVCSEDELCERHYGLRGKRLYTIQNAAAAIQNMLLAAHDLGLGAAWIGAFNEDRIRDVIDMPDIARPQAVITLGYPAEEPQEKRLRHFDDFVRFEFYDGTYRDLHRILRDLSVEWERKADETKRAVKRNPVWEKLKKFGEMIREKFGGE